MHEHRNAGVHTATCTYMHTRTRIHTHTPSPFLTCPNIHTSNYPMWYSQPFTAPQPVPVMGYAPEGECGMRMQTRQSPAHRLPEERSAIDRWYGPFETGAPRSKVG